MKKLVSILCSATLLVTMLAACSSSSTTTESTTTTTTESTTTEAATTTTTESESSDGTAEIALLISYQAVGVDDKAFSQMSWETVCAYGDANGLTYAYYQPADAGTESYLESFEIAINNGAKVCVCVGYQFYDPLLEAQYRWPDVKFIAADVSSLADAELSDNLYSACFLTAECGFLAGVAAVYEGYTNIGILSPYNIVPCTQQVYGFIQGANWLAGEMGIEGITIKHYFMGNQDVSPANQSTAASWFESGSDLIFANGGGANASIFAAAEASGGVCFGVDTDQYAESETILTSSMKNADVVIWDQLDAIYNGTFVGGINEYQGISNEAVGLAMEHHRMTSFTDEVYEEYCDILIADEALRESIINPADIDDMATMWSMVEDQYINLIVIE